MALIFQVARRAKRIAAQQMEFVAGVSHELCTPLAVINSAAENLMDGVIEDTSEIKEYGGMIRDQGRRLEHLVDEVLQFAAGRAERAGYELRRVQVHDLIAHSLAAAEPMLHEAGFTLEENCPPALPEVIADASAASMCLENLISNAVKYAGEKRWIGVRAELLRSKMEVQVSVEDQGIGIPARELAHIFEPFYRVESVRESPIRGVGLGLYLVKRAMEGMGGRVSVNSQVGRGSCFTLHFKLAPVPERATQPTTKVLQSTD
jgi:signal transduction histidine kinase